jgi:hypothetical protein
MKGRWPFSRKIVHDDEASGSASRGRDREWDRESVPWSDVSLPARWHLNSHRVPVPPVPRGGPERRREIRQRRALLPMHLWRDPAFAIESTNWDTFSHWEMCPDRRAGYLGDVDWDRSWEPVVSSDDEDEDDDDDNMAEDEDDDDDDDAKTPPHRVSGEVSDQIYNGRVVRDDVDDMINHVVYHYF